MPRKKRYLIPCVILLLFLLRPSCASGSVLFVPSEYRHIQAAIDSSSPGDTIAIEPGVYDQSITIFEHGVALLGADYLTGDITRSSLVQLRGDQTPPLSRAIRIHLPQDDQVTIAGLTIRDCYGAPTDSGTAIFSDGPSLTLDHVIVRNNQARIGTVFVHGPESSVVIQSCEFDSNSTTFAVGALLVNTGNTLIDYCLFESNNCSNGAAAIGCRSAPMRLRNSILRGNDSGPLYGAVLINNSDPDVLFGKCEIENNQFIENRSGVGAALHSRFLDTLMIKDNAFERNSVYRDDSQGASGFGGALYLAGDEQVIVEGNKFIGNIAELSAAAIAVGSNGIIRNNQFIGNRALNSPVMTQVRVNSETSTLLFERNLVVGNKEYTPPGAIRRYSMVLNPGNGGHLEIKDCTFLMNQGSIVNNALETSVSAMNNYWGDFSGPYQPETNPLGQGDTLLDISIPYLPLLRTPTCLPELSLQDSIHDFGALSLGEPGRWEWRVANLGVQDLLISLQNSPRPGFWIAIPDTLIVDDLDTSRVVITSRPGDVGVVLDTLHFLTNDPRQGTIRLYLRAEVLSSAAPDRTDLPQFFAMSPAQPNPFNPSTTVTVALPHSGKLRLEVFDLLGRRVALLANTDTPSGSHRFTFDATHFPSGLYLLRASSPEFGTRMQKVVLLK